jgi:hypothetical protein
MVVLYHPCDLSAVRNLVDNRSLLWTARIHKNIKYQFDGGETKKQQTREKVAVAQYKEPIKFTYKNLKWTYITNG